MKFGFNRFRRIAMKTSTADNRCNGLIPSSILVHCVCLEKKFNLFAMDFRYASKEFRIF